MKFQLNFFFLFNLFMHMNSICVRAFAPTMIYAICSKCSSFLLFVVLRYHIHTERPRQMLFCVCVVDGEDFYVLMSVYSNDCCNKISRIDWRMVFSSFLFFRPNWERTEAAIRDWELEFRSIDSALQHLWRWLSINIIIIFVMRESEEEERNVVKFVNMQLPRLYLLNRLLN